MSQPWFVLSPAEVLRQLKTTEHGLAESQVIARRQTAGLNALPAAKSETWPAIFWHQFQSPLIVVLLLASLAVLWLGDLTDALIIIFVLVFNAVIGTIQEGRAEQTLKALRQLTKTTTTVIRSGQELILPDQELVPGDIILLTEGQRVPADVRLISEANLTVNQSALTGETVPVHKVVDLPADHQPTEPIVATPVSDQLTMVLSGSFVTTGHAKAVVVATGRQTEIGKIAQSIEKINTDIPLKHALEKLTKQIIQVMAAISVILFGLGLAIGYPAREMFATVVALAVSAIPEGLPIVLTLVLATGVWRMSRRQALVKKLDAVEALGQATVIAVDKTGTITQNALMVTDLYADGHCYRVTGSGYEPKGLLCADGQELAIDTLPSAVRRAASAARLNATARIKQAEDGTWRVVGDPTEAALLVFATKAGMTEEQVEAQGSVTQEFPFDYERLYRASVYRHKQRHFLSVTGAPEKVLSLCQISAHQKERAEEVLHQFLRTGRRVVAFAYLDDVAKVEIDRLPPLTFGGYFAMQDGLHPETAQTVQKIQAAGLKIVMITGDHAVAATAIATEAGIFRPGDQVITGQQLELLSSNQLAEQLQSVTVFARVTPQHKQKIVEAYRQRGEVIAMTGDGVNDAPSLVAADLGLAMGLSGTEVAKEAADIVLLDDNLKSIVAAIEEGRSIYKTLKKVITYLFSTSAGEILVVTSFLVLGLGVPITAAQIIWLNLVTDGFLDVSLAMEPKEHNLLSQGWTKHEHQLVDRLMVERLVLFAIIMAIGTLVMVRLGNAADPVKLSSLALTVMATFQWFNAWNSRSTTHSVFAINPLTNPYLIAATVTIILLQLAALNSPIFQSILRTQPLSGTEWLLALFIGSFALWGEELRKYLVRHSLRLNDEPLIVHPGRPTGR